MSLHKPAAPTAVITSSINASWDVGKISSVLVRQNQWGFASLDDLEHIQLVHCHQTLCAFRRWAFVAPLRLWAELWESWTLNSSSSS